MAVLEVYIVTHESSVIVLFHYDWIDYGDTFHAILCLYNEPKIVEYAAYILTSDLSINLCLRCTLTQRIMVYSLF